jgi:hypothetical protein
MSCVIIFVCHDNDSVSKVISHNYHIIFVGNKEIDEKYLSYSKLIIARNLEDNIEHESKLLTFTAWFAISKNNLFIEYDYTCILEYDVELINGFESILFNECKSKNNSVFSFRDHYVDAIYTDIDINVLKMYLMQQHIDPMFEFYISYWGSSSNQCVLRNILVEFVDFYYNSYLFIKNKDYEKLSWYHERVFMIYLKNKNIDFKLLPDILSHGHLNSHNNGYN